MKNKKLIYSWGMYDWANSVYALVIATAIFPIFYESVVPQEVMFFRRKFINTELYSYVLSVSFLFVAFSTPWFASISDFIRNRLLFFKTFCYLGALSCMLLYWFTPEYLELSMIPVSTALIGFSGSIVFYNAYLPLIASVKNQDKVSSIGFGMGYIGSSILLVTSLVLIQTFGMNARWVFVITGLWWAGFAQITFYAIKKNDLNSKLQSKNNHKITRLSTIFVPIKTALKEAYNQIIIRKYLIAFFFFNMGAQTVMYMAVFFGTKSISWTSEEEKNAGLIVSIILIQILAILGAYLVSKLSKKTGNIPVLMLISAFWFLVGLYAYFFVDKPYEFYIAGVCIGLVMGSIQSLARSTFSKLIVNYSSSASSFFSVYDFVDKMGIVVGIFFYGFVEGITSDIRESILVVLIFFVLGFIALYPIRKNKILR